MGRGKLGFFTQAGFPSWNLGNIAKRQKVSTTLPPAKQTHLHRLAPGHTP